MNKLIIIFSLFLLLVAGVVFYQLTKTQMTKNDGKVTIGKQIFNVEAVKTDTEKQTGLTKYRNITNNQGMLFIFDNPLIVNFWMKNMKFPIDMIFIKDDTIVSIVEKAPILTKEEETAAHDCQTVTCYKPTEPINYVLEVNSGLVSKNKIKIGDKVKIELK